MEFRNFDMKYAEVFSVVDFVEYVKRGYYNDYDGSVYYVLDDKVVDVPLSCHDLGKGLTDDRFTQVAWFSK